jgi:thiamine biosynthesis protein ThiS
MTGQAAPAGDLVVNGKPMSSEGVTSIGDLLRTLEVRPERVVVELNGSIYRRGEGLEVAVAPGDVVEIVHFVGGG